MGNQIITGAIGGLAFSLSGLAKKEGREDFDFMKMAPTIIVGTIIGALAGFTNQDYGIVANMAGIAGLTAVIENFWKAIWRKAINQ